MKLTELVDFEAEKRKIDQMKQVAKQQAARVVIPPFYSSVCRFAPKIEPKIDNFGI
ncbi:MAG: hypothetical protein P8019_16740 [Gammaproteobacteria bacterium]